MTKAAYDRIAQEYKASKKLSFRKCIESFTLFHLAGPLKGLDVMDLACGEGIYAREFKRKGGKNVLGVDLSSEMIKLAEEEELLRPKGCFYEVADAKKLKIDHRFDLITGVYLLNYARTKEELRAFCHSVYNHLAPTGRFVGINDNPFNCPSRYGDYRKYGFVKESPANRQEGDYIRYTMFNHDGSSCSFDNYYLSPQTYEEVFEEVGFKHFTWHWPRLEDGELINQHWEYFMAYPPIFGFSAKK